MAGTPLLHDRYQIHRKLGSGAFATVYLAEDLKMGRPVAVKVVEDSADVDGRALREARAAAKLNHQHIVHVYEVVREEGRTLLFSEYVEGSTLRELYQKRRLSDREVLRAGIQICRALEHAHKRGVVHRDIKPENVMLVQGEEVEVRVMDFGVARLEDLASITLDGDLVGTLAYMSPEQLDGRNVDARADVYGLAVTLYEGLTGRNPLRGKDAISLLREASRTVIPRLGRDRPDLPRLLEEVLQRALEKDPDLRLDAARLREGLEKCLRELPEPVEGEPLGERVRRAVYVEGRFERLGYVGRHLTAAVCSLGTAAYLLPRVPFYPEAAVFPLVVLAAFVSLLWPLLGGALTLALLAPPAFAFGVGWGVLYSGAAAVVLAFLTWRRKEWAALLPGLMPLLAAAGLGLALPALAGMLLRRWGPVVGFLAGLVLALAAGFAGWGELPYAFSVGAGAPLLEGRYETSPGVAAEQLARFLDARPELVLQALLFAVFAAPLGIFLHGDTTRRLWVAAAYLASFCAAFIILPPLLTGVPVRLGAFVLAYMPCVIIVFLYTLLASAEGSRRDLEG